MRRSVGLWLSVVCSMTAFACGGTPLSPGGSGSAGGAGAAGSDSGSAGSAGTGSGGGGGGGAAGAVGRVPAVHRVAATACPVFAPPAMTTCPFASAPGLDVPAGWCNSVSDCTSGKDGLCQPSINGPWCSCTYDACFADADCPGDALCLCSGVYSSNTCVTASCHVDADCGPGGYCSPVVDGCSSQVLGYACHTPKDTCSDNKDCPFSSSCAPDPSTKAWRCGPANGCLVWSPRRRVRDGSRPRLMVREWAAVRLMGLHKHGTTL